ncbi:Uncharacterised protein [Slackia heliotrinireducens]|uniref:DnaJ-like protein n=1 Tax=Slackia heliotrinireducens (strain ATCC 29202 / DSM 20476 / NCTC 11029 / RHS 1) TaxID=471855 RepID=C7N3E9_SLAHD|nr:molecular chaperone DnaJ [Slackia heliotrinireducens]ACV23672.1 DnaJ-like protein [Slackia heliotrinireducens DSM 20476]VEH03212.1 Uncharacterised protein [Slackia heliotrinireducens]
MEEAVELDRGQMLRERIEGMRRDIASALLRIDEITLQINPQIEADYAVKIGCYENELLQAQIAARRSKRRLALVQARINRGETVDALEIENQLDAELAAWEAQLQARVDDYLEKLKKRTHSEAMIGQDAEELKALHRELVKRLHPDLHGNQSDRERQLFDVAQAAFKTGDLDVLRSLEAATRYLAKRDVLAYATEDELAVECELLEIQLEMTKRRLEQLEASAPYNLRDKLRNIDWVCARVDDIRARIAEQNKVKKEYDSRCHALEEGGHAD